MAGENEAVPIPGRISRLLRCSVALALAASMVVTTMPAPPAHAFPLGGGGGGNPMGGFFDSLSPPGSGAPAEAEGESPSTDQTAPARVGAAPAEGGRAWIGVRVQPVTRDLALGLGLPDTDGALVASVAPGGPADQAGVRPGDVLLAFDDQRIQSARGAARLLAEAEIGAEVVMGLWRRNEQIQLPVTIETTSPAPPLGAGSASTGAGQSRSLSTAALRDTISALRDALDAIVDEEAYDIGATAERSRDQARALVSSDLLDRYGKDPEIIRDWVSNNTALVPYRGMLKGAGGVLLDREGNSLDRALLLAKMLEHLGYQVRLGRTILDGAAADRLLRLYETSTPPPPAQLALPEPPAWEDLREQLLAEHPGLAMHLDRLGELPEASPTHVVEAIRTTGFDDSRAQSRFELRSAQRTALKEYWVVQVSAHPSLAVEDGDRLLVLDDVIGQADLATVQPVSITEVESSSRYRQNITVRFDVTLFEKGTTRNVTVFEHTLSPEEVWSSHMTFHLEPFGLDRDDLRGLATGNVAAAAEAFDAAWAFVPVLYVDDAIIAEGGFTTTGNVRSEEEVSAYRGGPPGTKALFGLGDLLEGVASGNSSQSQPRRVLAGSLIFSVPGDPYGLDDRRDYSRTIFDVRKPRDATDGDFLTDSVAARLLENGGSSIANARLSALLDPLKIRVETHRTDVGILLRELLAFARFARAASAALADEDEPSAAASTNARRAAAFSPALLWFSAARWATARDAARYYVATPNIAIERQRVHMPLDPGSPTSIAVEIDVVANRVEPTTGFRDPFVARLEQGARDGLSEALALTLVHRTEVSHSMPAIDAGLVRLANADITPPLSPLGMSQIRSELAAGRHVFVPPHSGSRFEPYLRVDPVTGQTLSLFNTGSGASTVEYWVLATKGAGVGFAGGFIGCVLSEQLIAGHNQIVCDTALTQEDRNQALVGCMVVGLWGALIGVGLAVAGVAAGAMALGLTHEAAMTALFYDVAVFVLNVLNGAGGYARFAMVDVEPCP